jgi:acetyltransferase
MPSDREGARALIEAVAGEGRSLLTEPEAKSLLSAYGIATPETAVARDEDAVSQMAGEVLRHAPALVVKLLSRTITHKSDVGGVILNIRSAQEARSAAEAIRARVAQSGGCLEGFTVQPMVVREEAEELIAGLVVDPNFGPTVLFGAGGTSVEVADDTATGIVPLDDVLAGDLIDRTRVGRILAGYRDRPPADRAAIIDTLRALSQIAIDLPAIRAIDINPLLVGADGVIALDARVELDPSRIGLSAPNPLLAIRPYPAEAEKTETIGGQPLIVRPIRPEDAELYPDFLDRTEREDLRLRFLAPIATISHYLLVRLTQLDYDREMAFVAIDRESGLLCGISRYAADPDRERAEFGLLVRSDLKGRGLGTLLMNALIAFARSEGIGSLEGLVLRENTRMIELCRALGFTFGADQAASEPLRATLTLKATA